MFVTRAAKAFEAAQNLTPTGEPTRANVLVHAQSRVVELLLQIAAHFCTIAVKFIPLSAHTHARTQAVYALLLFEPTYRSMS